MKKDAKREAIRYWWEKALEAPEAAGGDLAAEAFSFAINRAYYALFYAVCALLLEEGRRFEKHSGVRAAFNQHFVKSGRLARKHGDLYNRLFRDRQEGDYVEFTKFDDQYEGEQIKGCEEFLGQISATHQNFGRKQIAIEPNS